MLYVGRDLFGLVVGQNKQELTLMKMTQRALGRVLVLGIMGIGLAVGLGLSPVLFLFVLVAGTGTNNENDTTLPSPYSSTSGTNLVYVYD